MSHSYATRPTGWLRRAFWHSGTIQAARLPVLDRIIESVQEAVGLLPPLSAGRTRVEETRDYFTFIREDSQGLDKRWRAWRGARCP